jgi:hypothetical protein
VLVDCEVQSLRVSSFAELDEARPFVQDVKDDFADTVSNGPAGFH